MRTEATSHNYLHLEKGLAQPIVVGDRIANTLRIEGNLANERLYNALVKRYGMTTVGGVDVITIPLR
jgi:hypothetical protein